METQTLDARNMVESHKNSLPVASEALSVNIQTHKSSMHEKYRCFNHSGCPIRVMYFGRENLWIDFIQEVVDFIKGAFVERKTVVELLIGELRYLFDFLSMLQIEVSSGNKRSIAWIDDKGNCFFPKLFFGEDFREYLLDSGNKIGIEVRVVSEDERLVKRRRNEYEQNEVESKRHISNSIDDIMSSKWPNVRQLREDERTHSVIKDKFLCAMKKVDPNIMITSIHQCTRANDLAKVRFELFQRQVQVMNAVRGSSNVVCAWHGGSAKFVENSLLHGFSVPSKVSGAESYGVGMYLSQVGFPQLSAKFSEVDGGGERHILLCRVILGNVEKLNPGSQQCFPSSVDFDTGTDDPKDPKWYIVWSCNMSTHILPDFVVSFKSSGPLEGQMRVQTRPVYTVETLYSNIRSLIPTTKDRDLVALCNSYKTGKLQKNGFIKQLREVVGDVLLLSIIRNIRSMQ